MTDDEIIKELRRLMEEAKKEVSTQLSDTNAYYGKQVVHLAHLYGMIDGYCQAISVIRNRQFYEEESHE